MHDDAGAVQPYYVFLLLLLSCFVGIAIGWAGVNEKPHPTCLLTSIKPSRLEKVLPKNATCVPVE